MSLLHNANGQVLDNDTDFLRKTFLIALFFTYLKLFSTEFYKLPLVCALVFM